MTSPYAVLTFDCYGTLIDWRLGIWTAFAKLGREAGHAVDRDRILELHARIEPQIQAGSYRSYREILDRTAAAIAAAIDLEIPVERRSFLSASLAEWPAFPDTGPTLEMLARAGHRLGILSNVDDELLASTLVHLPVDFELLVTAEQVGSYKPALGHFREARRRLGATGWLHVAQSFFHDVQPAVASGLPVVWINRLREVPPTAAQPVAEFPDLATFGNWLLEGCGRPGS